MHEVEDEEDACEPEPGAGHEVEPLAATVVRHHGHHHADVADQVQYLHSGAISVFIWEAQDVRAVKIKSVSSIRYKRNLVSAWGVISNSA